MKKHQLSTVLAVAISGLLATFIHAQSDYPAAIAAPHEKPNTQQHYFSKSETAMKSTSTAYKHLQLETRDNILIVHLNGGSQQLIGLDMAEELSLLLDALETTHKTVDAVIFTGVHADYFLAHADVNWLQQGGASIPKFGLKTSSMVARTSKQVRAIPGLKQLADFTPLEGGMQLDKLHDTFLRMNKSGVIFIAALNGSAMGLGSEFAQACDVRIMADGPYVIGQPEILLGINPGGGGTQRLTRLVGTHRALMMMLEGQPVSPQQALAIGYVDEVVTKDQLMTSALERAQYLGKRPKSARAAIKRAAYLGSSETLEEGLHRERTEFIHIAPTATAQRLMTAYVLQTEQNQALPFYNSQVFKQTLKEGALPLSHGVQKND